MQEWFRNAVIGILLCCMMLSAAVADIGGDDPAFFYDTALKNVELDRYADAEEYFAKAGSYKDAALWKRYCEAIQKTNGDAAIADLQTACSTSASKTTSGSPPSGKSTVRRS